MAHSRSLRGSFGAQLISLVATLSLFALLSVTTLRPLSAAPLTAGPPTLTDVSPPQAYNYQATTVTITGTNFVATPTVTLGNVSLSDVTFVT